MALKPPPNHEEATRLAEAIAALNRNHHFEAVKAWMRQNLSAIDGDSRWMIDETLMRQGQGRAQILEELLGALK